MSNSIARMSVTTARAAACAAALFLPAQGGAQSLLERSPNVSGNWTGPPGTLHFNFAHRFSVSDAPERKVSNVPTFLLAAGLPGRLLAGFNYSTNSSLAPRFPNEWELFARWSPLSQDLGAPLDAGAQLGYNNAADGVDAEVSVARRMGRARGIVAGRALSNPVDGGSVRFAVAGAAIVRIGQYLALAGDLTSLTDRDSAEKLAWSAGIHFAIPLTPHTLSIHATNALLTTLQGASRGSDDVRYGFEFTIPVTLRRYFGRRAGQSVPRDSAMPPVAVAIAADTVGDSVTTVSPVISAPGAPVPPPPAVESPAPRADAPTRPRAPQSAPRIVRTVIRNVSYLQPRLTITAGTTVEWTNSDPMPHSVTAVDRSFDSGLINPGKTYRRTFTKPGTYDFFCVPHPFMKGTIVVRAP